MIFNSTKFNTHWSEKSLSSLGTFRRGKSKHRPRNDPKLFKNGTYPLIQTGEIKNADLYINTHNAAYNEFGLAQSLIWPKNTMCITIAANIAETGLLEYPMCFPDSVVGFIADPNKTSELFMHYVFSYIRETIQKTASGSIQDNINIEFLTDLIFKIPTKRTQDIICNVLENIDKKIELNNKISVELEAMAKLIYDYWFVQFDFPDENGKPYKSSGGKMVFNEDLNREIPDGWNSIPISNLLNIKTGKEDANFATSDGKYPFFTCGDKILNCDDYAFEGKAILLAGNGTFGIKRYVGKFNAYQRTYVLIPNEESHFSHVYFAVKAQAQQLTDGSRGSIVKFITIGDIENINLVIPPDHSVCSTKLLNNLFDQSDYLIKENKELARLRDWLLPMLMNGQVTVSEAS
jgi:type I restriction enzyme, S subunit